MSFRSPAQRLRQHHAIEHASITVLSKLMPTAHLVARSDLVGFIVYGNVDSQLLREATEQGLSRLQAGESSLAVHPNCGTNLVAAGMLSGVAALLAGSAGHDRSWMDRLPSAVLGATLGLILAQPFGRWLQQNVTTSPEVDGLQVASVTRLNGGPMVRHRVSFAG
jgi:hypothetical protein